MLLIDNGNSDNMQPIASHLAYIPILFLNRCGQTFCQKIHLNGIPMSGLSMQSGQGYSIFLVRALTLGHL